MLSQVFLRLSVVVSLVFGIAAPATAESRLAKIVEVRSLGEASERVFFGRVRARQTIDLAFQVAGQIVELPVNEGQRIEAGDLIAQLDLEPYELNLARAQAQFEDAEADFTRLSSLAGSTVSKVTLDDAETAVKLTRIALQDAERSLRLATLRAPFDGIVAARSVPNFTTIGAGTPVVRLHDMSDLRIEFEVPEILFQQAGSSPDVRLQAEFAASDQRYDLEFRELVAETTQVGQAFRITVGMEPRDELNVLPGSSATVYALLGSDVAPLVIPKGAVIFDAAGAASVMVFEPTDETNGTVRRQTVEIAPTSFGAVQVISGLTDGQEIVAAGGATLNEGDTVERFSGFSR